jgi:hypothetical protein
MPIFGFLGRFLVIFVPNLGFFEGVWGIMSNAMSFCAFIVYFCLFFAHFDVIFVPIFMPVIRHFLT